MIRPSTSAGLISESSRLMAIGPSYSLPWLEPNATRLRLGCDCGPTITVSGIN